MQNVKIFSNQELGNVRVVLIDGEPWMVGKDVAAALGYARPKDAVSAHCRGAVKHRLIYLNFDAI